MVCRWVWHFGWENVFRRQVWDPKPHTSTKSSAVFINCINVATANSASTNAYLEKETGANIITQDLATIPCTSVVPQPAKISRITYNRGSHAEDGVQQPSHLLFPWWRCGQKPWDELESDVEVTGDGVPHHKLHFSYLDRSERISTSYDSRSCSPVGFPSMELPCAREQGSLLGTSIFWFLRYCSIFSAHYINIYTNILR